MPHEPRYNEPVSEIGKAHLSDHKKFRDRTEAAGRQHRFRAAEIERDFAAAINRAKDAHTAAVAAAPKVPASNWQGQQFYVPEHAAVVAADTVHRKAIEAADKARKHALQDAAIEHSQEIDAARQAWRKSPGWLPHYE
jgi:hypothetical protein